MTSLAAAVALACPICFQFDQGPVTSGVRAAVLVLVGVTTIVLAGFVRFAIRVARHDGENGVPTEAPR